MALSLVCFCNISCAGNVWVILGSLASAREAQQRIPLVVSSAAVICVLEKGL